MKLLNVAIAAGFFAISAGSTFAAPTAVWQSAPSPQVHLIVSKKSCTKSCKNSYKSCIKNIPADYQGHPGREANWKSGCENKRTQCKSKC